MNKEKIQELISQHENPRRTALSKRFPMFKGLIIFLRRSFRKLQNILDFRIRYYRRKKLFLYTIARHQSVLKRKLGNSDPRLQDNKIKNIEKAVAKLNGVVIPPGKVFSFWEVVGKPTYWKGYVDGMLLSGDDILEGIEGGLCQVSNFLFWILLHAETEVVERYHHARDIFPDSGRVLPFASGATILYNFIDLKLKNTSPHPIQIHIWLTDTHLKGKIVSNHPARFKFSIKEKKHHFIKKGKKWFRFNEIWREKKKEGKILKTEKVVTNFAPVIYKVSEKKLKEQEYEIIRVK